nr:MAG TPA: hypothetical protein [Bacteriophage sp.]
MRARGSNLIVTSLFKNKKSPHSSTAIFECEDSTFHQASNGKDDKKIQL